MNCFFNYSTNLFPLSSAPTQIFSPSIQSLSSSPAKQPEQPEQPKNKRKSIAKLFAKNFIYGGTAGATGLTATFPIDLAKTRLQSQVTLPGQKPMYRNVFHAIKVIARAETVRGLYRGLPAALIGIFPEKAIKLSVNDLVRELLSLPDGSISIGSEVLAGMSAGFCQCIATNTYELVKIRLQEQGKLAPEARLSALQIVRQLGLRGLFTGTSATLLRDIPFSALYFSSYGRSKLYITKAEPGSFAANWFQDEQGRTNNAANLVCGIGAGVISSWSVTPADCIKTRIQAETRLPQEERIYKGIVDCFQKTLAEEGAPALFKGATARVAALAPLFGISLMVYELLQRALGDI